jgi:hypothetical protein
MSSQIIIEFFSQATAHELKWAQHKSSAALATDDLQRRQQQHHAQLVCICFVIFFEIFKS